MLKIFPQVTHRNRGLRSRMRSIPYLPGFSAIGENPRDCGIAPPEFRRYGIVS